MISDQIALTSEVPALRLVPAYGWKSASSRPCRNASEFHAYREPDQPRGGIERSVDGVNYRFGNATSAEHLERANDLIKRRYEWRGYDAVGAIGGNTSRGQATFLAHCGDRVDGTLTIRVDGQTRLLAEQLYPEEIAHLRRKGARLCEIGRLAFDEGVSTLEIFGPLFHLGIAYARWQHACTDMVTEVNPRHVGFYQRAFGGQILGDERTCSRVAAPAVLLHLSLERAAFHADVQGGERSGRKSIYPYCFARHEIAAVRREVASLDTGIRTRQQHSEHPYALI